MVIYRMHDLHEYHDIKLVDGTHVDGVKVGCKFYTKNTQTMERSLLESDNIEDTTFLCSDIAYMPQVSAGNGYNFSNGSTQWLLYEQSLLEGALKIEHALTSMGDKRLYGSRYTVDGYLPERKIFYNYHVSKMPSFFYVSTYSGDKVVTTSVKKYIFCLQGCLYHGCRLCYSIYI